jgi:hypothetical protein
MHGLLLALVLLGAPRADDVRSQVLLLPVATEAGVSAERARQLSQALEGAVAAEPGFRLAVADPGLVAALADDPGCRDQPACLKALLASEVTLAVDARLAPQGVGLALELRLLQQGELALRHGATTSGAGLARAAERELSALLVGFSPELWLYLRAKAGEDEAADQLEGQFPHSPWLLALQDTARRQPPPASSGRRPGAAVVASVERAEPEPPALVETPPLEPAPTNSTTTTISTTTTPEPTRPPPSRSFVASTTAAPEPTPRSARTEPAPAPSRSFVASDTAEPEEDPTPAATTATEHPGTPPTTAADQRDLEAWQVPKAMRSGTDDARFRALELAESRPGLTGSIVWVMKHDPNDEVRRKAWRVIRARWRKGVGTDSHNQAAAIWVFEHRPSERAEAAWAIAQYGQAVFEGRDMLAMYDAALKQPYAPLAYDLAAATLVLGGRHHRSSAARMIVEEAIERERDALRRRQLKRALTVHGRG